MEIKKTNPVYLYFGFLLIYCKKRYGNYINPSYFTKIKPMTVEVWNFWNSLTFWDCLSNKAAVKALNIILENPYQFMKCERWKNVPITRGFPMIRNIVERKDLVENKDLVQVENLAAK